MGDVFADLRRAGDADATVGGLALHPDDMGAAFRAGFRHDEGLFLARSLGLDHLDNLGDNVARPLNDDGIPDADVFPADLLLVVQRGTADHDAADADRPHDGDRCQDARPADLDDDIVDDRPLLDCGELAGDGPAGASGDGAEALLNLKVVDLDDDSVDLIGKLLAYLLHVAIVTDALLDIRRGFNQRVDLKAPSGERLKNCLMRLEGYPFRRSDRVAEQGERPPRRDPRIELAERPCCRVAGIGE